jgi:hypothetical protein
MTASFSELPPARPPFWFRASDQVITLLQRVGFVVGTMHVLVLPGRQSGIPNSTPVTMLTINGQRYIAAALDDLEWVLNARAAGRGILRRGRVDEHVSLIELPIAERAAVLRELPRLAPGSVSLFRRLYGVPADAEAFAGLAPRCPVFVVRRQG